MPLNSDKVFIEKLDFLIDTNLENTSFSTENICSELGVSRSHLFRLVKEQTQLSTSLYIRKRRLEISKKLLNDSDLKIAEIAYKIGIDSPQNFTKYFTQEYGVSPTEFRKKTNNHDLGEVVQVADSQRYIKNSPKKNVQKKWFYVFGLLMILSIISGIIYWKTKKTENESNLVVDSHSIAILPFKNLGNPETSFFTEGIMEQIHSSISLIENVKVISKTSSNQFKDSKNTIPEIANQLKVGYILAGNVLQLENKVRISLELIHAEEDKVVWSKNYDGEITDIFSFMNKISSEIAEELNPKLSQSLSKKIEKKPTENIDAYKEYLQGVQLLKTREKTKLEAAIEKFSNAIRLDSEFANAYAELANTYFLIGDGRYIDVNTAQRMAEKNALNAIRIDGENVMAYATLANLYRDQYKWEQANTTYQIALKYNPNDAIVNYWYSLMLRSLGRREDAFKYSSKAVELDPLNLVINGGHIFNCLLIGRADLAEQKIKEGELLFSDSWVYYWAKGYYFVEKNDFANAAKEMEKSHKLNPNVRIVKNHLYFCKAKLGLIDEVKSYLKTVSDSPENYSTLLILNSGLQNKELAMAYLEKMAEQGVIPTDLKVLYFYKIFHNDKRYIAILKKFGLS